MTWAILDLRVRFNFETLVALPTNRTPPSNPGLEDLVVLFINCPTTVEQLLCDVYADGEMTRRTRLAEARVPGSADAAGGTTADAASFVSRAVPIRASTLAEAVAAAEQIKKTDNTLVAITSLWVWYAALPLDQRKALCDFKNRHDLWIAARFHHQRR
jgi:hypothetical protein